MRSMERVISLTPIALLQVQGKVIPHKAVTVSSRKRVHLGLMIRFLAHQLLELAPHHDTVGEEQRILSLIISWDMTFSATDQGYPKQETFSRFDSMSSSTQDNFSRFDSMSSTAQDCSFARFDSMSSNAGFDHGHTSFDDSDPFGSSGPFKVTSESHGEKWNW